MKLNLHVTWKAADEHGYNPHSGDRVLSMVIERPYSREPVAGELLDLGEHWDSAKVEQVEWAADGCHLHLGRVLATQGDTLEWLHVVGFEER